MLTKACKSGFYVSVVFELRFLFMAELIWAVATIFCSGLIHFRTFIQLCNANFCIVIPASAEMPGTDSMFHTPTGNWDSGTRPCALLRG